MQIKPPTWLFKEQRAEYIRLAKIVPGFNPVLDQTALAAYVSTCTMVDQLKAALEDETLPEDTRADLQKSLQDFEDLKLSWAEKMGLTPASHLMIIQALKKQARRPSKP